MWEVALKNARVLSRKRNTRRHLQHDGLRENLCHFAMIILCSHAIFIERLMKRHPQRYQNPRLILSVWGIWQRSCQLPPDTLVRFLAMSKSRVSQPRKDRVAWFALRRLDNVSRVSFPAECQEPSPCDYTCSSFAPQSPTTDRKYWFNMI